MAEFDQDSKNYIAESIKEMEEAKRNNPTWTTTVENTPNCTVCNDNGKKNGCGGCGATS